MPEPELELVREDTPADTHPPSKLLEDVAVGPRPLPVGKDSDTAGDAVARRLFDALGGQGPDEYTGVRRSPWPIDIVLYPASLGGLITLFVIVGIPFLLGLYPLGLAGLLVGLAFGFYTAWYLAECVYDSAKGGTRAPMALDTTDLDVMLSRVLYLAAVYVVFLSPPAIYWIWMRRVDPILLGLVAWAVIFFPMGLLAMVIHDSISALNPFFLLGAILRTFFPYICLLLLLGIFAALRWCIRGLLPGASRGGWLLGLPLSFATTYVSFIIAHILGRFYWRYRDRLDWGI